MRLLHATCLAAASLAAGIALAGGDAPARLLLSAGLSGLAAKLAQAPQLRGAALYRAGAFEAAAEAFAQDEGVAFNRGNALARDGRYAEALVAYDLAIAADPDDAAARANFGLVMSLFGGTEIQGVPLDIWRRDREGPSIDAPTGKGGARAQSTGSEATNTGASFELPELTSSGLRRVPRLFDEKYIAASERWLATLEDQPGRYLAARLAAERKRRERVGLAPPQPEDPQ